MASTVELEEQVKEAGNMLTQHPFSVDELLPLLDQVENFLSRVEQSPPKSMLDALSPSMKALVEDGFLRHSDADVKVAVASCISEITRITAPDAPYDDDKMKDVFQLIVSSFENLSDQSSRSYNKRASILETVAKVRSCVVMLDLECDGLIVEMFEHFLKAIRDYHPENVFSSMETIMTLVLEESEDICLEMLTPILASVKRDNEEVLPVARKLGESVLSKSADKLKPYLMQTVRSLGVSLNDYSQVVASICEGATGAVEHNDENASGQQLDDESKLAKTSSDKAAKADESKLTTAASEETTQVVKECMTEGPCPDEVDPAVDRSPKSVMSNGMVEARNEEAAVDQDSSEKPEPGQLANQSNLNLTCKVDTDDSDAVKSVKSESKPEQTAKRRGRKSSTLINSIEPSDSSRVDSEIEAEKLPDCQKSHSKDICSSPDKDPSIEVAMPSENEKNTEIPLSSPKAIEGEAVNAASSSPSGSLIDGSRSKKAGPRKKTQSLIQEDIRSIDVVSTKAPEGTSDSKPQRRSGKKAPAKRTKEDKIRAGVVSSKRGETTSDSEAKPLKQYGKKVDAGDLEAKDVPSMDVSIKAPEGKSESEVKPQRRSGKKAPAKNTMEDKIPAGVVSSKKGVTTSDSEAKPLKKFSKKLDAGDSEAKDLRQLVKKIDGGDSEAKPLRQSGKKGDANASEMKPLRQTEKKGDESDSEAKPLRKSGKKEDASGSETKPLRQTDKKGDVSDSEAKPLKQSGKRGNTSNSVDDKSSLKKEDGKSRRRVKNITEKDLEKSFTEDDEMGSSPKSRAKSAKDEGHLEETPTTNPKRKRTTGKEEAPKVIKYDDNLVGSKVKVWWPKDREYYEGFIESYDPVKMKHKVVYVDNEEEILNLKKEKWEFVEGDSVLDVEQATEDQSPVGSSEKHKKKKAKTDSGSSPAPEKMEISTKRKVKGPASKFGRRLEDDAKVDDKTKENTSKTSGKSEDDTSGKNKDKSKKSSTKSGVDVTPKAGKSKDDGGTPNITKTTTKSKQDSGKTLNKSKGKTTESGNKTNANGSGKVTSSLSKAKETEYGKGKSPDPEKTLEIVKGKSPGSGTKSGKKRRRRGGKS